MLRASLFVFAVLAVLAFGYFVWPTPFIYSYRSGHVQERTNRFTGTVSFYRDGRWIDDGTVPGPDTLAPAGARNPKGRWREALQLAAGVALTHFKEVGRFPATADDLLAFSRRHGAGISDAGADQTATVLAALFVSTEYEAQGALLRFRWWGADEKLHTDDDVFLTIEGPTKRMIWGEPDQRFQR